jgi:hypothetical protein
MDCGLDGGAGDYQRRLNAFSMIGVRPVSIQKRLGALRSCPANRMRV